MSEPTSANSSPLSPDAPGATAGNAVVISPAGPGASAGNAVALSPSAPGARAGDAGLPGAMVVSGLAFPFENGTLPWLQIVNGKSSYRATISNKIIIIAWQFVDSVGQWVIYGAPFIDPEWFSTEDVAEPHLVETWSLRGSPGGGYPVVVAVGNAAPAVPGATMGNAVVISPAGPGSAREVAAGVMVSGVLVPDATGFLPATDDPEAEMAYYGTFVDGLLWAVFWQTVFGTQGRWVFSVFTSGSGGSTWASGVGEAAAMMTPDLAGGWGPFSAVGDGEMPSGVPVFVLVGGAAAMPVEGVAGDAATISPDAPVSLTAVFVPTFLGFGGVPLGYDGVPFAGPGAMVEPGPLAPMAPSEIAGSTS